MADPQTKQLLGQVFFQALQPLLRRQNAERTLSSGKVGILLYLAEHGRATTTELAPVLQVSPQGISLAARELERSQFVARLTDAEDRRRVWIELTDVGRQKLVEELAAGHEWFDRAVEKRLMQDERKALEAVIPILRKLGSAT